MGSGSRRHLSLLRVPSAHGLEIRLSRVARAVMAEIGFSGQSLLLTASWLGLGAFTTIALRDELFEDLLGFDPLREPVFAVFGVGALEPDIVDHSRPRTENQDEAGAL